MDNNTLNTGTRNNFRRDLHRKFNKADENLDPYIKKLKENTRIGNYHP
jgi:hypothetical protein